jgi:hypothetical protein
LFSLLCINPACAKALAGRCVDAVLVKGVPLTYIYLPFGQRLGSDEERTGGASAKSFKNKRVFLITTVFIFTPFNLIFPFILR